MKCHVAGFLGSAETEYRPKNSSAHPNRSRISCFEIIDKWKHLKNIPMLFYLFLLKSVCNDKLKKKLN